MTIQINFDKKTNYDHEKLYFDQVFFKFTKNNEIIQIRLSCKNFNIFLGFIFNYGKEN